MNHEISQTDSNTFKQVHQLSAGWSNWMRRHSAIYFFVIGITVSRIVSANRHSYWMDELISVYMTGTYTDSFRASMAAVFRELVHPPLYEAILFFWMEAFGSSEVATRSLSAIFMAGAAVALYHVIRLGFEQAPAFFSASGFLLTAGATEYSLEARNYAQFVFLVTVSAFVGLLWLRNVSGRLGPSTRVRSSLLFLLGFINLSLLFTHYYSIYWLSTQATLLVAFLLIKKNPRWKETLKLLLLAYAIPFALFWVTWGWVVQLAISRWSGRFSTEESPTQTPWTILVRGVINPNLPEGFFPPLLVITGLIVLVVGALLWFLTHAQSRPEKAEISLFIAGWFVLPGVFVWAGYLILGSEIYHPRYFLYVLPALIPVLVLPVWIVIEKTRLQPTLRAGVATALSISLVAIVFPQSISAADRNPGSYREVAKGVVEMVNRDPEKSYVVLDTNRGTFSLVNFYFERYDATIRSEGSLPLYEDLANDFDIIRKELDWLLEHDYVVVAFASDPSTSYINLVGQLDSIFSQHRNVRDPDGRGYIVWQTNSLID